MSVHNEAKKGDIAETVLLPGDPQRAKFIAENFLEDAVCYNNVRGMLGYTGTYKGKRVSVQGTGMGIPSISIVVTELITEYDCKNLIRIGTCGSMQEDVHVRDLILGLGACTDSNVNRIRFGGKDYAAIADFDLLLKAYNKATDKGFTTHVGNILSSDTFYHDEHLGDVSKAWREFGVMAVEMEAAALYTIAAKHKRKALTILTVSDHIITGEATTAEERQNTFTKMMEVALELA
ncbi:purine-nucleoside phosphorylase [Halosquirtibacter laminarini]|uniref:Purine-nucleoside phosphorylase n=1 Tax=Halosquirtibacter laminarini TaxID=3374600 RepID=A0AC61NJ70_9BACT|nr:purine-nucleoside phosphorylase [Prolixibacteraceae bacterium]